MVEINLKKKVRPGRVTNQLFWLFVFVSMVVPLACCFGVDFTARFAPHQGIISEYEQPQRGQLCLNGKWQFQPIDIPEGYQWNRGRAPELTPPTADQWDLTPIKIPSAWNVNNWGLWREPEKYDPVPLYYPSYPDSWKHARMGWLRKTFTLPENWTGKRLILHFEGVAGECRVLLNGKPVVESHYDTFTPFEADVTDQVNWSGGNELLVGVRAHRLFNKEHPEYKWGWDAMGPRGSDMFDVCGIYQDVFLLALPQVYVEDVFVKPWLDRDRLDTDVTLRNTTDKTSRVQVRGAVRPWKNLAGKDVLSAPEAKWTLEDTILPIPAVTVSLSPGESQTITLSEKAADHLKHWSPDQPNLYGLVLEVTSNGVLMDRKYTRFGWRQFTIKNGDLLLNGERIQLYGDILHPFSSFIMTRRTAWAWYTMIKDFGGNAVRPHAQPWPRFYVEMADEMGLAVLDETGIFGSAGGFNMDEEAAWQNCRDEYQALILRDRNSPSVMGWSFANEMFALGAINNIPDGKFDAYREKLAELGRMAHELDPTRAWISCDGDEDLHGRLPVWSKHWGDGWKDKQDTHYTLPADDSKPWMLGEYSGSYYGTPNRLDYLNGDRAYESYAGRVEALGIDIYELAAGIARDKLDYFSASETVWFGLEHLNFGYHDFDRLPTAQDGVFFTRPYREGVPGMQPERLPPFVATLNPGWDPALPLYKPLAMFDAMKAALAPEKSAPFSGRVPFRPRPDVPSPTVNAVRFIGDAESPLYTFLKKHNLPITDTAGDFIIVDAQTGLDDPQLPAVMAQGKTVLIMPVGPNTDLEKLNRLLPEPIALTDRQASSFVHGTEEGLTAPFSLKDLYFVEHKPNSNVLLCGLEGPFVQGATVLLKACEIDWSLFNAPENRKCGSLILYEKLTKPSGAALVEWTKEGSRILVCTIDSSGDSNEVDRFWTKLFACLEIDTTGRILIEDQKSNDTKPHDLLRDGPLQ